MTIVDAPRGAVTTDADAGHGRRGLLVLVAGAAAVLPIVVAAVRAWRQDWYPVGDNAFFALRSRDVLTEHHPLLGTWTSASLSVGEDLNNPGPLLFDLLAPFAKLSADRGVMVGTALLNIACIVGMGFVARRRGDTVRTVAVLAAAAALVWTMGSELVIDPWQPHALMLPFLFFLVVVWNLLEGDRWMLPVAVGLGCLLVQTHLSYAVNVAVLGLLGVLGVLRATSAETDDARGAWRAVRVPLLVSVAVAAAAWAQPLVEQVQEPRGNLTRVVGSVGSGGDPVGAKVGARVVANAIVTPPSWWRPAFADPYPAVREFAADDPRSIGGLPPLAVAIVGLGALVAGLAWVAWVRRRRDVSASAAAVVALVAVLTAVITTAILPMGPVGFGSHQVRWLWPVGIFATMALVLGLIGRRPRAAGVLTSLAVVLGLWAVPAHLQETGWLLDRVAMGPMRELAGQLEDADIEGPVLFSHDDLHRLRVFEPYSTPTLLELDRLGVEVVIDEPSFAHQVGERRLRPETATQRLVLVIGPDAEGPPDGERIAYAPGLDEGGRAELDRLIQARTDGEASDEALARLEELQMQWDRYTIAVYLAPLPGAEEQ